MKSYLLAIAVVFTASPDASQAEDDGGFHSLADYRAADPTGFSHIEQENIDELFDTKGIAKRLAEVQRVRLFRKPGNVEERQEDADDSPFASANALIYWNFGRKGSLRERFGKPLPVVELDEKVFRPVLQLAADFDNYGDVTMCVFEPGVAILIGDDEPDFILICCFKCHDIHIVRRPTELHPMPQTAEVGMSPELEKAIFNVAKAAYPEDAELQNFRLAERVRSKTPVPKFTVPLEDPFEARKIQPKTTDR